MEKWKFSEDTYAILRYSSFEAQQLGNHCISVEHLFLSMIDQEIPSLNRFFAAMNVDVARLKNEIEQQINLHGEPETPRTQSADSLPLYKQTERLLDLANLFAKKYHSSIIEPEHLLLAILCKDLNNH